MSLLGRSDRHRCRLRPCERGGCLWEAGADLGGRRPRQAPRDLDCRECQQCDPRQRVCTSGHGTPPRSLCGRKRDRPGREGSVGRMWRLSFTSARVLAQLGRALREATRGSVRGAALSLNCPRTVPRRASTPVCSGRLTPRASRCLCAFGRRVANDGFTGSVASNPQKPKTPLGAFPFPIAPRKSLSRPTPPVSVAPGAPDRRCP